MIQRPLFTLAALILWASPVYAQLGSVPYTFSPNGTITSASFNTMFSTIYANALNRTGGAMTGSLTTLGLLPTADDTSDIGSAALSYHDAWIDGTLTVGTLAVSGGALSLTDKLTVTLTTAQMDLAYDASNYARFTVGSTGGLTVANVGGGATTFSQILSGTLGFKERGRSVALGEWANRTFAAGDYTAASGTWTVASGDAPLNRYTLIGKTVIWQIHIENSTPSMSTATLRIAYPDSLDAADGLVRRGACGYADDNGTLTSMGRWVVDGDVAYVQLLAYENGNAWAASTDATDIACTIIFEIA